MGFFMFRKYMYIVYILLGCLVLFSCATVPENTNSLITLVEENKIDEVKNLFSVKEDANQKNEAGETPLHIAARQNNSEMTRLLLSFDTIIDEKDNNGNTPLMAALKADSLNTAKILCEYGANVFAVDNEGGMPWQEAFAKENEKGFQVLITPETVKQKDKEGKTLLHIACGESYPEAAELLLENGAVIDALDNNGVTPLGYAYARAKDDTAPLVCFTLLKNGAAPLRGEFEYFENSVLKSNYSLRMDDGQTPLHYAAARGHDGFVQFFIDKGSSPNVKDIASSTPLHHAVRNGNLNCAKKLLLAGADVNACDFNGNTPLHLVMPIKKRQEGVDLLLSFKANPNSKDAYGDTPLHIATSIGMELSVIDSLVKSGADINERNKAGITPLSIAIQRERIEHIVFYVNHGGDIHAEDINGITPLIYGLKSSKSVLSKLLEGGKIYSRDSSGNTPLHIAVQNNANIEYIEMILAMGGEPNAQNRTGETPLHIAVRMNYRKAGELLLNKGGDVFISNVSGESPLNIALNLGGGRQDWLLSSKVIASSDGAGNTPLHYASEWKLDDSVMYIIQKGGNPNATNSNGETPLFNAARQDSSSTVLILLENGANPEHRDVLGNTPLHSSIRWSGESCARVLLQKGVDPNAANLGGKTPLHEASRSGKTAMVNMLIGFGADLNVSDETGKTPLISSVTVNNEEVSEILINKGASTVLADMTGRNALHYAVENNNKALITLLRNNGSNPLARDAFGNTPFSLAIKHGNETALCVLGEDLNISDSDGNTPVHIVVSSDGNESILNELINKGFPVNRRNRDGINPILSAVKNNNVSYVKILAGAGADPYLTDQRGDCALAVAIKDSWDCALEIIKSIGNKKDATGYGVLSYGAMYGDTEVVSKILSMGYSKNEKNVAGETPYDVAVRWGKKDVAEILK